MGKFDFSASAFMVFGIVALYSILTNTIHRNVRMATMPNIFFLPIGGLFLEEKIPVFQKLEISSNLQNPAASILDKDMES